jgi:hypothetical protein
MLDWLKQYWLQTLFSTVLAGLSIAYKKLLGRVKEQDTMKLAMQALLRNAIIQSYNRYMELGYCPIYEMENVTKMYEQYHDLDGDGTITTLFERLKELPTEPKKQLSEEPAQRRIL